MQFLARVSVTPKPTVNDPQGNTVLAALKSLGFTGTSRVRIGKYLELSLEASSRAEAASRLEEMCRQLLANPVIEQFHFDLEELGPSKPPTS